MCLLVTKLLHSRDALVPHFVKSRRGRCAARHAGSLRSPVLIIHYTPIYLYIIYIYVYNALPFFYITVYQRPFKNE